MPINHLTVSNFKGIGTAVGFDIRPITVFLGANSSGKSSCLHALVSLAQTLKLGNAAPSLVLDDDFAHVHLGRFVEIAHSHSYGAPITIGIDVGERHITVPALAKSEQNLKGIVTGTYTFRSTRRTQEVFIDSARLAVGKRGYTVNRAKKKPYGFSAVDENGNRTFEASRSANFLFQLIPNVRKISKENTYKWFEAYTVFDAVQREIETTLRAVRYLGPFRQSPLRRYPFRGATASEVGAQGEATITLLAGEHVQSNDRKHIRKINHWLNQMGLAKSVDLSRVGTSDLFDVSLKLKDGASLPIADLGYGLSQILPVLAQCSFAPAGSTLLFEQPELHLHEGAARKLAKVFHETIIENDTRVILETHSKELVYELLQLVKNQALAIEDLAIYMVDRQNGASTYHRVQMSLDNGHLEVDDLWVRKLTD